MAWIVLFIFPIAQIFAKPALHIEKRATNEQHIQDIFSRYTKTSKGWASYYGEYPVGTGACSLDPLPQVYKQKGWIKVAAGAPDFKKSLGCGMCLKIEASGNPVAKGTTPLKGTYYAVINDLCGACAQGDLDFYIEGNGKWEISFDAIDCPDVSGSNGNIQYRFTGSNPWYLKLQITNSKQPTAAVEFHKDGKWHCAKRTDDNHFVWSGVGEINFPLRTRLTSIAGETVGGNIPKLLNDKDQNSGLQFKKFKEVSKGAAPKLPCHGQGGLVRDGGPDEVTNQGQEATDKGPDSGTVNQQPTTKPETTTHPETKPGNENKGTTESTDKGENGSGNDKKLEAGGGEETTSIEDFCKNKASGIYADPTDCEYFIQCANSRTFRKKCPSGLHWNDKIKNCDKPSSAGCSKQEKGKKPDNSFIVIDAGKKPANTNQQEGNEEQRKFTSPNLCPDIMHGILRYHYPSDCSKFILCNGTFANTYRCPDGYLFDKYRNKCRKGEYVSCDEKTSPFHESNEATSGQLGGPIDRLIEDNKTIIDSNYCLGKTDGFYKMENECQGFYKCSRGLTKLRKCPDGLLFNAAKEVCDWPRNVECQK